MFATYTGLQSGAFPERLSLLISVSLPPTSKDSVQRGCCQLPVQRNDRLGVCIGNHVKVRLDTGCVVA